MKTDNQWHNAICVQHADGSFGIYDDKEDAAKNGAEKLLQKSRYQDVQYNWNHGQPLVNFGDFTMSIVDVEQSPNADVSDSRRA